MRGGYNNNEIDMKIKLIEQTMHDSHHSIQEKLDLILTQTTRHNGRLSSIEKWRAWSIGYASAVTPIIAWITFKFIQHIGL